MTYIAMGITATALAYALKRIWPDDLLVRIIVGCIVMVVVF